MKTQDVWLANLRMLVDHEATGRRPRDGIRAVAAAASLNEEYVYQLYAGKPKADGSPRAIGLEAALAIARAYALGRDESWFNIPQSEVPPARVVAQTVSQYGFSIEPRRMTWEELMAGVELEELFVLPLRDDALAPRYPRGFEVVWSTSRRPEFGSLVLVRDAHGHPHAREYRQGNQPGHWIAGSYSPAFREFDSAVDQGLQIIAAARYFPAP